MSTDHFKTSDIWVAAFLVARGHNVLGVEMEDSGSQGVFLFPTDAREGVQRRHCDNLVQAPKRACERR